MYPGDDAGLGFNFERPQDMTCPCVVCRCEKPRRRKKKRYHTPEPYETFKFEPCVHRYFQADPVVRECLTHEQYLDMLATPKAYPWLGEAVGEISDPDGKKSKKKKRRRKHEEEPVKQENRCMDFSFAEEFINDMWDVMSPDVTDRLIDFLVQEFGMSVEEAEDFIDCKSSMGKQTPCVKKQSKALVSLGPKHKWVKKFSDVFANRIEQYIVSIMMAKKTPQIKKVAERIFIDMSDITGDVASFKFPKTKRERTLALIATRIAFWVEDIMKDLDKPRKERPPVSEEEESETEEEAEEKEEKKEEEVEEEIKPSKEKEEELKPEEKPSEELAEEKPDKAPKEEEPVEEEAPVEEEKPAEEEQLAEEEKPTEEEEQPTEEQVGKEEEAPTEEEKLAEEEVAKEEEAPPEEEKPAEEEATKEEEAPAEEEPPEEIKEEVAVEGEEGPAEEEKAEVEEGEEEEAEEVPLEEEAEEEPVEEEAEEVPAEVEKEIPEEEEVPEEVPEEAPKEPVPKKSPITIPRKPVIPAFEVRAKTGSTLQIQKLSSGTVVQQTAQARGVPVPPRRKVPASESPLNLQSAEEWVDWASNIANTAEEWGNWLDSRLTEAEKQLTDKRKRSDWKAWMDEARTEALKWRVEEERMKDEGERWGKKLNKQLKNESETVLKVDDLTKEK